MPAPSRAAASASAVMRSIAAARVAPGAAFASSSEPSNRVEIVTAATPSAVSRLMASMVVSSMAMLDKLEQASLVG